MIDPMPADVPSTISSFAHWTAMISSMYVAQICYLHCRGYTAVFQAFFEAEPHPLPSFVQHSA